MLKRIFCLFLAVLLLVPLTACLHENKDEATYTHPDDLPTMRKSTACKDSYLAPEGSNVVLQFYLPYEWTLQKTSSGFDILSGKDTVGSIVAGQSDSDGLTLAKETTSGALQIKTYASTDADMPFYRMHYTFADENGTQALTLDVNVEALDAVAYGWLTSALPTRAKGFETPAISLSGTPSRILILGNSFVSTSKIGSILQDMLTATGKNCQVDAISIGFATVSAYTENYRNYLEEIERGSYDAVFMCGFYYAEDVTSFAEILRVSKKGGATPVIFPAHNENLLHIDATAKEYPEVTLLHWKNEVNLLIDRGVSRDDFCIDDGHNHSTPLAGYVGAHMIYRTLYKGTLPPSVSSACTAITAAEIAELLGDYPTKGIVYIKDSKILYLPKQ